MLGRKVYRGVKLPVANKSTCRLNMGNHTEVQKQHITNRKFQDSVMQGSFDRASLLREMIVGVEVARLNKGMPLPTCFDWRGWFEAGVPFFEGDMTLRLVPKFFLVDLYRRRPPPHNFTHLKYHVTPEAVLRLL
ncbi:hypothetical protein J6590_102568 [Homalodisca vitripennis]|nr:hypothetical protein J6590_102568 [Homalodisca vitripennis]